MLQRVWVGRGTERADAPIAVEKDEAVGSYEVEACATSSGG